jgi:hypothetical protein
MFKCSEIFSNSFYPPKIGELVFKEGICDKMFHLNFLVWNITKKCYKKSTILTNAHYSRQCVTKYIN